MTISKDNIMSDTTKDAVLTDEQIRKSMTSEQIQLERRLTCEAIDGAIAFGYQNTNAPPSDDHWLAPFWKIGRKQAELETMHDNSAIANALEACDWSGIPVGNKAIISHAISLLRGVSPQAAICMTCKDHGMIGGPSYRDPDEGGVPCPDCATSAPSTGDQS